MWVLSCGGRGYQDRDKVFQALDLLHAKNSITVLVHGACTRKGSKELSGSDRWSHEWAMERGVPSLAVPARWGELGDAAGPERNGRMLLFGIEGVVSFPGGDGTADMVRQAEAAGLKVWHPHGK